MFAYSISKKKVWIRLHMVTNQGDKVDNIQRFPMYEEIPLGQKRLNIFMMKLFRDFLRNIPKSSRPNMTIAARLLNGFFILSSFHLFDNQGEAQFDYVNQ